MVGARHLTFHSAATSVNHTPKKLGPRALRREQRAANQPPSALLPGADVLPTAAASAAAASLLTALWLQRVPGKEASAAPERDDSGAGAPEHATAAAMPDLPTSIDGIWEAAWQGFAPVPAQHQQQGGVQSSDSAIGDDGRQAGQSQDATAAAARDGGLQRTPVLLLQGIRGSDRSRLLALCLAALEAQVTALPAGFISGPAAATAAQWRQLTSALLALSSTEAAASWLGYVPELLLTTAFKQLQAADPVVLRAAGLQAAAAALQHQAAAAGGGGADAGPSTRRKAASRNGDGGSSQDGFNEAVQWYCLDEKLQLYSSVVRLLTCSCIEGQHGGPSALPTQFSGGPAPSDPSSNPSLTSDNVSAAAPPGSVSGSGHSIVRSNALQLLRQQQQRQEPGSASGGIRGWRATAAGTRNDSQLLALAPAVLQDMAVTAADAVAAAYLADAATAGPVFGSTTAASSSAVVAQGSSSGSSSSGVSSWLGRLGATGTPQHQRQPAQRHGAAVPSAAVLGAAVGRAESGGYSKSSSSSSSSSSAVPGSTPGSASSGAGSPLESGWWPTFVHSQLSSTRQLQRFANQVSLNRWVERNYRGVADIYEDRLRLFAIGGGGRLLASRVAPMKRTPELGRLKGLRYAASLLLEAVDLLSPVLRTLWGRATAAASWLVVRAVGEAVALVRRGIQLGRGGRGDGARGQQRRQGQARRSEAEDGSGSGSDSGSEGTRRGPSAGGKQQRRRSGDTPADRAGNMQPGWAW